MPNLTEAPKVLAHFELSKPNPDAPAEALIFAVHPESGDLVMQLAITDERLREFTYSKPCSIPLPPPAAVFLASKILEEYLPEIAELVSTAYTRARLSVIDGGGGTPEAS